MPSRGILHACWAMVLRHLGLRRGFQLGRILRVIFLLILALSQPTHPVCKASALGGQVSSSDARIVRGRNIPVLKMLKRQIRHFASMLQEKPIITLVFKATLPVDMRWFLQKDGMIGAEVPNMIPIEGDDHYQISYQRSGEVLATSITLLHYRKDMRHEYLTVISSKDGRIQYQIKTHILLDTPYKLDDIDSPEWMAVPTDNYRAREGERLRLQCKVFVPHERIHEQNQLSMHKTAITHNLTPHKEISIDYQKVGSMHKYLGQETGRYAEEYGPTMVQGRREGFQYGHTVYTLRFTRQNATSDLEGFYLCRVQRDLDTLYIRSKLIFHNEPHRFPRKPVVDMVPCDRTAYHGRDGYIRFNRNNDTCIRCRALGYPKPNLSLYRDDMLVRAGRYVTITRYTNVADGGLYEVTYIFRAPHGNLNGTIHCRGDNENGSDNSDTAIIILNH